MNFPQKISKFLKRLLTSRSGILKGFHKLRNIFDHLDLNSVLNHKKRIPKKMKTRFSSLRNNRSLGLSISALCCSLGTMTLAQTNASMSTSISETTHLGQQAFSIRQSGTATTSGGNTVFGFDELFSVDPGALDNSGWVLQQVIVRLRLDALNQELIITNNGTADFISSDTKTAALSYNWNTFSLPTRTFDPVKESSIGTGNFPIPVLAMPNGVVIAADGGTYNLSPENPVQSTLIENNVSNGGATGYSDYDGVGGFDWTFFTNPTFASSGFGQDILSTSDSGSYQMFAEVEYIVIPEPGALGLMVIALGTAGTFAFVRMRKKA
ncbi:MAG: hypothetical protein PF795_04940 [Kiritimatiellae bacterium]|jgi:hypothetical protein|nr:hypothetical protein [Kiritimatiellia bacterium]